jgi:hypothetical protein
MNAARLRKTLLSDPENTILSMRFVNDKLVGHAFATRWHYGNRLCLFCFLAFRTRADTTVAVLL